jgi:hypothetical protein
METIILRCRFFIYLFFLLLTLSGLGFGRGLANSQREVSAEVLETYTDTNGNFVVLGYACMRNIATPLRVDLSLEGLSEGAAQITRGLANLRANETGKNDLKIPATCRVDSSSGHAFRFEVSPEFVRAHPGERLRAFTAVGVIDGLPIKLATDPVLGKIQSTLFRNGDTYITGWACQKGIPLPLVVKIYRNGKPGSADAVYMGSTTADLRSTDAGAIDACGKDRNRFEFKITNDLRKAAPGQRLYAEALSADPAFSPDYPLEGQSRVHAEKLFFVSNAGAEDATNAIKEAIAGATNAAAQSGAGEVVLGKGTYNVTSCALTAQQHTACFELNNLSSGRLIVGGDEEGTEILMHQIETGTFQARTGSNNISLMDFGIDYTTPGFTQGEIVAVRSPDVKSDIPVTDRETLVDVAFNPDPQYPSMAPLCELPKGQQAISFRAHNQWGYIADKVERGLKHDTPTFWFPQFCEKPVSNVPHIWRLHMHRFFALYAKPGDRYVQVVTRSNAVLLFFECNNVTLDNVSIHAGGGQLPLGSETAVQ